MKKHVFVTFLVIFVLLPSVGPFAQQKAVSPGGSIATNVPEGQRINAFRVDKIIGAKVINLEGKNIGTIDTLVIDIDTGSIEYAALEFGGFLGFGDKLFAVPWQSLAPVPVEGIFILDQSKAKLEKAPGFDRNDWPDIGDKRWGAGIYRFYKRRPPFHPPSVAYGRYPEQEKHPGRQPYPGYAPGLYPGFGGDPYREMFNPKTMDTVSGEVVKVEYYVPEPNLEEGTRLVIYTDAKKPVLVYLGPARYLEGQGKALKSGDRITVTGSLVTVDETPFMIATHVKAGNEELQLRDNEGHPNWIGWEKIK